jgi:hypothetical protein
MRLGREKHMKTVILVLTLFICNINLLFSQEICLSSAHLSMHPLAARAGISASVIARFDVIGREGKNIKIFPADSLSKKYFFLFDSITVNNIQQITFLNDKMNCNLLVNYIIHTTKTLSNNYSELISDSVLNIVFRGKGALISKLEDYGPSDSDSLTFTCYVPYTTGMKEKSNILVQRIFNKDNDSTIILRNNYPEYESLIYKDSKDYTKGSFVGFSKKAKYYFIRFFILRRIEDCGYEEIL